MSRAALRHEAWPIDRPCDGLSRRQADVGHSQQDAGKKGTGDQGDRRHDQGGKPSRRGVAVPLVPNQFLRNSGAS